MTNEMLLDKAKEALKFAYTPYSQFNVGAALLTESGKVYTGCNIENASYGATNCAERTAIFKAISEGERKFLKIAIVSESKSEKFKDVAGDYTYPCGICRQVISEFMPDGEIILNNKNNEIKVLEVSDLLPNAFNV